MIKIISGTRRAGKTYQAIQESARTGFPILTISHSYVEEIKKMALEMGLIIPLPMTWNDAHYTAITTLKNKKPVIIDDADQFLEMILKRSVWTITVCEPVKYEKLENPYLKAKINDE